MKTNIDNNIVKLPSGMTLHFIRTTGYQTSVSALVKCGSKNCVQIKNYDNAIPYGLAHFLEHMLFYKQKGYIGDSFVSLGEYCNARTKYSGTVVYSSANFDLLKVVELVLQTILFPPTFKMVDFKKEYSIICEEIRKENSYFLYALQNQITEKIYDSEAIKYPNVGSLYSLKDITLKQLESMYSIFYHPSNVSLYIVGKDIDVSQTIDIINHVTCASKKIPPIFTPHKPYIPKQSVYFGEEAYNVIAFVEYRKLSDCYSNTDRHMLYNMLSRLFEIFCQAKHKQCTKVFDINIDTCYFALKFDDFNIMPPGTFRNEIISFIDTIKVDQIKKLISEYRFKMEIIEDHIFMLSEALIDCEMQGFSFDEYYNKLLTSEAEIVRNDLHDFVDLLTILTFSIND